MSHLSVCKNVIAGNNKRDWIDPLPPIRISKTASGKIVGHEFEVEIVDKFGAAVAWVRTTKDGKPIIKCGAKVAIVTKYDVRKVISNG